MTSSAILGPLSNLHEMQAQLLESLTPEEAAHPYHPELGSLNWQFGQAVYQELHWLRLIVAGDDDLSKRVAHLFTPGKLSIEEQCSQLPPTDHLLNWAAEIRDDHLMRLANPAALPDHPLLVDERLQWFLLQEQAKHYETMLLLLNQRSLQIDTSGYQVTQRLKAAVPHWETKELSRGHYRVGARDLPAAYDNELPAQAVELTSFRIALDPISNAEFLAFMEAEGYQNPELWDETGRYWLEKHPINHPEYWRQDTMGNWYVMGVNGPSDLPPDEPVSGINRHEAQAYANWISSLGGKFEGAVLQHEYQWEIAVRTGVIKNQGRAWEWCSNPFHPYPGFQPFPARETSETDFDEHHFTQRGGCLHTQRVLRRPSLRDRARPAQRFQLVGLRLVFPPLHEWT
ncbi:MAG: hypothetical protein OI74_16220 [Gammaproteobacteria bacterium (ex Lamellibrachia satsuma)]|nr:MAG: SUMF1/EgtB/PvdO family nonheme iron enzyme [Gammaproteobacteria bacterium (ex Lamellibrachia satsuma)]RRS30762.1 MAG: hypothetical protein OI74_16220 [Gammaproteobacteria bacterium (ex Lamellibrachia satsuma)]RRS36821.1 MAG: hypothetical protein NV67_04780 [Gammaproteobacteria bacterium (ex Lamellibrachia satsuma)]